MFCEFRNKYGQEMVKIIRNFITCFKTIARERCHLDFNHRCKENNIITPSLRVRPHIRCDEGYRLARKQSLQNLRLRIQMNHKKIQRNLEKMVRIAHFLRSKISDEELEDTIKFAEGEADADSKELQEHHKNKLERILRKKFTAQCDRQNWVKNLSSRPLTETEEEVLRKGLNFAIAPSSIPKNEIAAGIESGIQHLPEEEKTRLRVQVCNVLRYAKPSKRNLSKEEWTALSTLRRDKSIIILKADKGNSTVVMDRRSYEQKVNELLQDRQVYEMRKKDPTPNTERKMNSMLLTLKKQCKIPDQTYFRLRSTDGICPRLYCLPKIHKPDVPLRPIVSFVNSPTYFLSKYLCTILTPLISDSVYQVKNSFEFVEFVKSASCRPHDVMVSFDVVSLFTNIPINLGLDVAIDRLSNDSTLHDRTNLSISDISSLLEFCLNASDFYFNGNYYHQKFGCPMGSPISMIIANLVMQHLETKIMRNSEHDVLYWRRFADDTWVVLPEFQISKFLNFINSLEPTIRFTIENEDDRKSLTFLDVKIERKNDMSFQTSYFSKLSNTDRLLNFSSNHPIAQKKSVINSLFTRIDRLTIDDSIYQHHFHNAMNVLSCNGYPLPVIKQVLSNRKRMKLANDEQKILPVVSLPYVFGVSEKISNILFKFGVKVCHKPLTKIGTFLPVKDKIDVNKTCGVVYRVDCGDCERSYIGQTKNALSTRIAQHKAALRLIQPDKSALAEHSLTEGHRVDWSSATILSRASNHHRRLFLEALHSIKTDHPLNRCELFVPSMYKSVL